MARFMLPLLGGLESLDAVRRKRIQANGYASIAMLQPAWDELARAVDLLPSVAFA